MKGEMNVWEDEAFVWAKEGGRKEGRQAEAVMDEGKLWTRVAWRTACVYRTCSFYYFHPVWNVNKGRASWAPLTLLGSVIDYVLILTLYLSCIPIFLKVFNNQMFEVDLSIIIFFRFSFFLFKLTKYLMLICSLSICFLFLFFVFFSPLNYLSFWRLFIHYVLFFYLLMYLFFLFFALILFSFASSLFI